MTFDIVNLENSDNILERTSITVTVATGLPNAFRIIKHIPLNSILRYTQYSSMTHKIGKYIFFQNDTTELVNAIDFTLPQPATTRHISIYGGVYGGANILLTILSADTSSTYLRVKPLKRIIYNVYELDMYFIYTDDEYKTLSDITSHDIEEQYEAHLAPPGKAKCDYGNFGEFSDFNEKKECENIVKEFELIHNNGICKLDDDSKSCRTIQYEETGYGCVKDDPGWGAVPFGCTVQSGGDWAAHLKIDNINIINKARCDDADVNRGYQLVCRGPPKTFVFN